MMKSIDLKDKIEIQSNFDIEIKDKLQDIQPARKKEVIKEIVIESLSDYIYQIDILVSEKEFTFFRGDKAVEDYRLVPKLYKTSCDSIQQYELDMLTDFTFLSASKTTVNSRKFLEEMLNAQHYELPTRLLDWSESALIALYFAVFPSYTDNDGNPDSIIWALNPKILNSKIVFDKKDIEVNGAIPIGSTLSDKDDYEEMVKSYYKKKKKTLYPVAIKTRRLNPRIEAQRGVFLLYCLHDEKKCLTKYDDSHEFLIKMVIKKDVAKTIYKQLLNLGITHYSVFPEINSISKDVQNFYSWRSK